MKWLRRIHGAAWWAVEMIAHKVAPRRLRQWICNHVWTDTQLWYWFPTWQWGEWRSSRDIKAGRFETYTSDEEFLVSLTTATAGSSHVEITIPRLGGE